MENIKIGDKVTWVLQGHPFSGTVVDFEENGVAIIERNIQVRVPVESLKRK